MMHDDLLDIAEQLARLDSGRPRQASLRRAVSTAYYALFHALAYLCADRLVGWRKPSASFTPIYRTVDHGRSKNVFRELIPHGGDLAVIGGTFIKLQEYRHTADYDPEAFRLSRADTLELIDEVRKAMVLITSLSSEDGLQLSTQLIARKRPAS
jgi:uncharacterized protein (UPF0332 family)